jgi:hypothetical protein
MPPERNKRNKPPSEKTIKSNETKKKLEAMGIQIPYAEIGSARIQGIKAVHQMNAAIGHPGIKAANQKNAAMGYSIQKGTIKIAHQTNAAMGHPNLQAANQKNAEMGYPGLKAAHQKNAVMGYSSQKANAEKARSQKDQKRVVNLIDNSNLPDGTKYLFKNLKYSKEDVELAIDLHNQTSSGKSASQPENTYLDDF